MKKKKKKNRTNESRTNIIDPSVATNHSSYVVVKKGKDDVNNTKAANFKVESAILGDMFNGSTKAQQEEAFRERKQRELDEKKQRDIERLQRLERLERIKAEEKRAPIHTGVFDEEVEAQRNEDEEVPDDWDDES